MGHSIDHGLIEEVINSTASSAARALSVYALVFVVVQGRLFGDWRSNEHGCGAMAWGCMDVVV